MSDPQVVVVTIDFAPWDTDIEPETRLFEFNGPGNAEAFHNAAISLVNREVDAQDMTIGVYEPHPATRFGHYDMALMALRDWIGEAD